MDDEHSMLDMFTVFITGAGWCVILHFVKYMMLKEYLSQQAELSQTQKKNLSLARHTVLPQ